MNELSEKLTQGYPLGYLLGFSEFYGQRFFINPDVLIPRPETELLVELIVNQYKGKINKVLDVGTGSGVILLSLLAHDVGETGIGVDISSEALRVAKINANRLRLKEKVDFKISDRLDKVEGTFDLIVSNPPYIKRSTQIKLVHKSVDQFEPHSALYLEDEIYEEWFHAFFESIKAHLNGAFFMEGHEMEVSAQAKILVTMGFQKVSVLSDLTGRQRFIEAYYNSKEQ